MAATAPAFSDTDHKEFPATAGLASVPDVGAEPESEAVQRDAEQSFWRATIIGMAIGAVVCAGIWALLALVAVAGRGWPLGPALWMAAAVGVCAGIFYGGVAGTMIGARKLEAAEHATRVPVAAG
jgi:hypothetical protein